MFKKEHNQYEFNESIFFVPRENGKKFRIPGFRLRIFEEYASPQTTGAANRHNSLIAKDTTWESEKKIIFLFFFAALFLVFLFEGRLFQLQIMQNDYYRALAEGNRLEEIRILPPRGIFYDTRGEKLVENRPSFSIKAVPDKLPKDQNALEKTIRSLSQLTNIPETEIEEKINSQKQNGREEYILVENIPQKNAVRFQLLQKKMPGTALQIEQRRIYSYGEPFAHILGYLGRMNEEDWQRVRKENLDYSLIDILGKTGLEVLYEQDLRGVPGRKYIETDAFQRNRDLLIEKPPVPGSSMVLATDAELQQTIYSLLQEYDVNDSSSLRAAVVAIDPSTGAVRALVSYPSFDNNIFSSRSVKEEYARLIQDSSLPLFNRAIQAQYPSGSTIKPLVALAALAEGVVTPQSTFLSTGGIRVKRWFFPDWKAGGHGRINLRTAIAESVNTYFYIVGGGYQKKKGLGVDTLAQWYIQAGLGKTLGIDLPGEMPGLVPTPEWKEKKKDERWYIGDTYHLAIGQGDLLATPLQITAVTAGIANGGTIYQPYIVERKIDAKGNIFWVKKPRVLTRLSASAEDFTAVREGMRAAVTEGSARSLSFLPLAVAGKTGTAQVPGGKEPHAWFTSFAPYQNPSIALTVVVENGGEGSAAAVPIARDIFQWYARNRLGE